MWLLIYTIASLIVLYIAIIYVIKYRKIYDKYCITLQKYETLMSAYIKLRPENAEYSIKITYNSKDYNLKNVTKFEFDNSELIVTLSGHQIIGFRIKDIQSMKIKLDN